LALAALAASAAIALGDASASRGAPTPSQGAASAPASDGSDAKVVMPPVGLSIEYPLIAQYMGTAPCPPPALGAELLRLGSPPLHIGGNSQDLTIPNGALVGPQASWDRSTLYALPASFWSQLHCLLSTTKEHLTAGINLKSGEAAWAAQMATAAVSAATNGVDFSIGNEPDLYYLPNYASLGKALGDYETTGVNLYLTLAGNMRQALGTAPVIGPELARPRDWRKQFRRVLAGTHMQTVGVHLYPLSDCGGSDAVTTQRLLDVHSADAPDDLSWVVSDANAAGDPAIISEANSAACGGQAGVSDAPASAVWAVRFVLSALKTGFQEVRFHMSGGPYDPFIVHGNHVSERPIERAVAALNSWLPVGSSLQTLHSSKGVVATAVTGGRVDVIYDNERPRAQTVTLARAHSVHAAVFSPTHAGLASELLPSHHGRVKLKLAANSIAAILP
jgi:hypothetical protein